MGIRILLADEHQMVLEGVKRLLGEEPDMQVVGETRNGPVLVQQAKELRPEAVVLEAYLPGMNGMQIVQRMLCDTPKTKVVVLSIRQDLTTVLDAIRAGAKGYVTKNNASHELIHAIRSVLDGHYYLNPDIVSIIVHDLIAKDPKSGAAIRSGLSPRETEVMCMLTEGCNTKKIAKDLGISPKTVGTHRQNIMSKLGVDSLAALVKYALREGLTTP